MNAYIVNYLKNDRSRNVQTVVVTAKSKDDAVEKAYEEVGGFYDVGEIDVMSLAEARRKSLLSNPMKKKTRKKVVRRKRRSMREKRVMKIKRGLMKRAKKLHLGAKRTGAYVYGTLRRIVGNPGPYQHPHFAELKKAGFYDVLHNIEYGGDPMDISLDKWKKAERLLGKVPYGSTLRPLIAHRIRYVKRQQDKDLYGNRSKGHRTHGLSLKQMMKLYRLVSSGNPKAVMYARRTLGIPMSESLSQVKAVVYHHVLDLKGKI